MRAERVGRRGAAPSARSRFLPQPGTLARAAWHFVQASEQKLFGPFSRNRTACLLSSAKPVRRHWALAACLLTGLASGAAAQSPVILRYASPYPSTHPFSRADLAWIAWVEAKSGGRLRIEPFWGGMLMSTPESVLELAHGMADIATVLPIYSMAGAQAIKLQASFYAGADTPEMQIAVYACLRRQFPVLDEELAGTRLLAVQGGAPGHVLTRSRPIHTLADLRGLRIRVPSELVPDMRALGADPVTMAMGEVYSALSKGAIDGVIAPADTLLSLHFSEVAPYFSGLTFPRGAYPARAISDRSWNRLPHDLQQVLTDSQPVWEQALATSVTQAAQTGYAFGLTHGETMLPSDAAAQHDLLALYDSENRLLVARADAKLPYASAMYAASHQAISNLRAGAKPCPTGN